MFLDVVCIAVITVFIIDLSGVMDTIKRSVFKWLVKDRPYVDFKLKPFDCSLCMTHHICLLYALISGQFSLLMWMFICVVAFLTPQIKGLLRLVSDMLVKAENAVYDILDKND